MKKSGTKKKRKINSKTKGKVGELEFCHFLKETFGIEARRGQQFSGSPDSPDVITSLENIHFEVKRTEKLSIHGAIAQAKADAGDKIPVVAYRRSRAEWLIIFEAKNMNGFSFEFSNRE